MNTSNALQDLLKIDAEAREFGFQWPYIEMVIDYTIRECHEVLDAIANGESSQRIQEEIGDLIHTTISLCIFAGFDVNATIAQAAKKFSGRIQALKEVTRQQGLQDLNDPNISMDFKLQLWKQVKESQAT